MQAVNRKRRKAAAPVGGVFIVLALIGIITVIVTSIRLTTAFIDNDREKDMFTDLIRPVAMFNPVPFENPTDIKMDNLLLYSMWVTLSSDKRDDYNDNNELLVPASDLDVACGKLFGSDVVLEHQNFRDYETMYYYDETEKVYNVPITAQTVYTPQVEEVVKDGEFLKLTVAYIPPINVWTMNYVGEKGAVEPEKHMIFVMRKSGDSYQIAKVQDKPSDTQATGDGKAANQN